MGEPPEFLTYPVFSSNEEIFRPIRPSRRGELVAWLSAIAVGISIAIIQLVSGSVPCYTFGILGFLLATGVMISFGNWLEVRTSISVSPSGIHYHSPVRKVRLPWPEVGCLAAVKTRLGWRVLVEGEEGRFAFRTGGRIAIGSLEAPLTGYPDGERLASIIRGMAGLSSPTLEDGIWLSGREAG